MLGVGLWEIVLTVIVAILIVPPKKWPDIANQAGILWVQVKTILQALKKDLN